MKNIIRICFLVSLMLMSGMALAQTSMTVNGTVKDAKGDPIIGAAVMLEGSTVGVVTDIDGKYSITFSTKSGKTPRLVFSSISFITQEVNVDGRSVIDIMLEEDLEQLDEVVVVGYGAMKKSDITGSVTSVKIDETKANQSSSLDQLLQGQAAGVQVVSNSAAPDAGVSVVVRGASSSIKLQ